MINNNQDKIQDLNQPKKKKYIFIFGFILIALIGISAVIFFTKFKNNQQPAEFMDLNIKEKNSQQTAKELENEKETKNQGEDSKVDLNGQMEEAFPWDGDESLSMDKDGDYLLGHEEVYIYHTDPNNPDTDNDGHLDGEEVRNGYNPLGEGKLK